MANHDHIEVIQQDNREWRSLRVYGNGRRGERSEESFEHKRYLIERVRSEHPDMRVHVVPLDEGPYWIEPNGDTL